MTFLLVDAVPNAETIRRKAAEVLGRPEYHINDSAEDGRSIWGYVVDAFHWCMERLNALSRLMEGWPVPLQWVVKIVLVVVLLLLVAHIIYTVLRSMRVPERSPDAKPREGWRRDPRDLERMAEEARGRSDFIGAVRLLFRAAILRLENAERRVNRPGTTNRELLRRYRTTPVHSALQKFVTVIDTKWYGGRECGPEDYESCRSAHGEVRNLARRAQSPAPAARLAPSAEARRAKL
jgi:Domain of unknown function (DUF4129)